MKVLLTGGTGYIGSHTAVAMIEAGHDIIIADNLCNSSAKVLDRIREITGVRPKFYECDVMDRDAVWTIFREHAFDAVVHFAGLKAVEESVRQPLQYYRHNLGAALTVLEMMAEHGVKNFVFSSSATVYGEVCPYPYLEDMKMGLCASPYGWTKSMIEQILTDAAAALLYFNVIVAHGIGLIGEAPQGTPNNLMPYLLQVAAGKRDHLTVFGGDYDTPDGTCRRDYLHVMDLAEGHVKALEYAEAHRGTEIFNLGTGIPYSVLEIIDAFERNTGVKIPYEIGARRKGDLPEFWADVTKAERVLGWKAKRGLDEMCRDRWNWEKKNPEGYGE